MKFLHGRLARLPHPIYIRLAKGGDPIVSRKETALPSASDPMRKAATRRPVALMSTGVMTTKLPRRRRDSRARRHRHERVAHPFGQAARTRIAVLEHAAKAMLVVHGRRGRGDRRTWQRH